MSQSSARTTKAIFRDRRDAGRILANALLSRVAFPRNAVVLALPRGGVPVAFEIAAALRLPLDVCVVRSLEAPGNSNVVMGGIASDRVLFLEQSAVAASGISEKQLIRVVGKEARELGRRERAYRGEVAATTLFGRSVILVDDGLVLAPKLLTAIAGIRAQSPSRLILAAPVAGYQTYQQLRGLVDSVVCLEMPTSLESVPVWYDDYTEVSDLDVRRLYAAARETYCASRGLN